VHLCPFACSGLTGERFSNVLARNGDAVVIAVFVSVAAAAAAAVAADLHLKLFRVAVVPILYWDALAHAACVAWLRCSAVTSR